MTERVITSIDNGIAHVRLNRPDKRNGLDGPMFEGIIAAGVAIGKDPSVRVVVLSGEGKAFCAGLDFKAFMAMGVEGQKALLDRPDDSLANVAQRVAWVWQEVPVPVIAALQGSVFGGGFQIALGADIRLAAADTQMSAMEIRYGLIPDMSASQTLLRMVRPDVAAELVFTGRVIDANEALSLGLVTRIVDEPLKDAMELARTISRKSPHAIRAGKRLLREAPGLNTRDALQLETELQLGLFAHSNQGEAVLASMQKRDGKYSDPI